MMATPPNVPPALRWRRGVRITMLRSLAPESENHPSALEYTPRGALLEPVDDVHVRTWGNGHRPARGKRGAIAVDRRPGSGASGPRIGETSWCNAAS